MRFFLTICITCLVHLIYAQDLAKFDQLKCAGDMPDDFKTALDDKYSDDISSLENSDLKKKQVQEFAVTTNYYNHSLLMSGSVLYGDELSTLANKIVDKLLENEKDLRDKLRVYTVKSNHVNAYSTNQGIIYVTLGLFGRVETEAQLAYVLAHEISHYKFNHVLESYENQIEMNSRGGSYRNLDLEEKTLSRYKYSRDAEFEADKEGFEYYVKAGYDIEDIYTGFNVLLHGYLPVEENKYSWSKIESDSFKIAEHYLIDSCQEIKENEDIDDELLTHPNINKRKKAIREKVDETDVSGNTIKYAITTEDEFAKLRDLARFEMVNSFLRTGNYISGLYHIQVLQKTYPDNDFLYKAEIMCWYGMQKLISNSQKRRYNTGYRDVEGQEQAIYYFASKMPTKGINILATKFIWEESAKHKKDPFVEDLKLESLKELAKHVYRDYFVESYPVVDSNAVVKKTAKRKRKPKKIDFTKTAFVELFRDKEFLRKFKDAYDAQEALEDGDYEYNDDDDDEEYVERVSDSYVPGVESNYALSGVKKMIFLQPKFVRIDMRRDVDQRMLKSTSQEADLNERCDKLSDMAGVELVKLNDQKSESYNTESFNDYTTLQDWLREEFVYKGQDFHSFSTQRLGDIRTRYGTDYLGINHVWHYSDRQPFNGTYLFLSLMTFYPLPFYLHWQFKPLHQLDYAFVVFDLEKGDIGFYDLKSFPAKYRKDVINSHLYNSFNQLSRGK